MMTTTTAFGAGGDMPRQGPTGMRERGGERARYSHLRASRLEESIVRSSRRIISSTLLV